eukprot:gene7873-12094_t
MDIDCSNEGGELSSVDNGDAGRGEPGALSARSAVEARISAAKEASRRAVGRAPDFYAGDASGHRSRSIPRAASGPVILSLKKQNPAPAAHSYRQQPQQPTSPDPRPSSAAFDSPGSGHLAYHAPVVHPPSLDSVDPAALRAANSMLQAQVEALKKKQSEAAAAVLAAQHRHEANLVKIRDKQAKQGAQLQEKQRQIAGLEAALEAAQAVGRRTEAGEEQRRALAEKLQKKDQMIAELRLSLDKTTAEKKRVEARNDARANHYAELLAKLDAKTRPKEPDSEVEALLNAIDLESLPETARRGVEKVFLLALTTKAEIRRLRVHLAARSNSPSANPAASPASLSATLPPQRNQSPFSQSLRESRPLSRAISANNTTPRSGSPGVSHSLASRFVIKEAPKGEEAWRLWNEKKRMEKAEQAKLTAEPKHPGPWRGGGIPKRPVRAPSPSQGPNTPRSADGAAVHREPSGTAAGPMPTVTHTAKARSGSETAAAPAAAAAAAAAAGSLETASNHDSLPLQPQTSQQVLPPGLLAM